MKVSHLAIAIAFYAACSTGNAVAEDFNYYGTDAEVTRTVSTAGDCGCETSCGCATDCCNGCGCPDIDCGDPWSLQNHLNPCGNCYGINWGGWIQVGGTANDQGVKDLQGNSPIRFNHSSTDVMVNQAWLWAGREADTGGCGFDWGFRVDYVFGYDGNDTQAFGGNDWDTTWVHSADAAGFPIYSSALPQAYFEVGYNDWIIKLGHFFTIIGYESVPAPDNFFYSRAYTMLYGEPFTHTGVLASYAYSDRVNIHGGYTTGWDAADDNDNDAHTFLGGFDWTSCSGDTTFAWMINAGDWGDGITFDRGGTATTGDIYIQSLVLTHRVTCDLTYIIQSDYGANDLGTNTNEWYGVNQYLLYDINCCWAAGLRFEWFRDDAGVRVPTLAGSTGDDYYAVTGGLNWKPHTNFVVRPELRYDWVNGGGTPFALGTEDDLLTGAVDLIVLF
ncbi:MAG: porin [Planctomycetota bacterium]|nr:MAG: porin [Planctomycetota bacterium]REK44510.1 MAG: porin [Planctomycetota bacterium]